MNDLADKIEAAEGPSRELFLAAMHEAHGEQDDNSPILQRMEELIVHEAWLDAAMTLVPEGFGVGLDVYDDGAAPRAQLVAEGYRFIARNSGGSIALALCAAALKARQSLQEPKP